MTLCSHTSHDDHLHGVHDHDSIHDRIQEAEQICSQEGARLTPLRKEVLSLILAANAPIGAYDLLAKLKSKSERPAAPPTVYRTLDFLLEYGFVHRLTSINAFIPCCHPREGHQAAFLICQKCHTVKETSANNLFHELEQIAAQGKFKAKHSIIEISGTCQQCQ
ncbi:Fur family transcriptional regulator [Acinetobacter qingfengensis]|uniref:Fur family transcriptional regulator n=1 Tax=Acinetobacter qingfengensis TaxID=1262585 RepID=A0A1E7RCY0_9GAMM|nr:transcriptional repressor [Acinetobacter qingfengensis]KAA8732129.1 Fur family transcriptional regulator [Acinetobacter qingfengensis]OEY97208.1 Fur family transcriptional regulator [Acinetobacter qingfengensis]